MRICASNLHETRRTFFEKFIFEKKNSYNISVYFFVVVFLLLLFCVSLALYFIISLLRTMNKWNWLTKVQKHYLHAFIRVEKIYVLRYVRGK